MSIHHPLGFNGHPDWKVLALLPPPLPICCKHPHLARGSSAFLAVHREGNTFKSLRECFLKTGHPETRFWGATEILQKDCHVRGIKWINVPGSGSTTNNLRITQYQSALPTFLLATYSRQTLGSLLQVQNFGIPTELKRCKVFKEISNI